MPLFSPRLCILGTDTDAGKSVACASLARAFWRKGLRPFALKPVQSGCTRDASGTLVAPDCALYREACPQAASEALALLEAACSPHLAARMAGRELHAGALAGLAEQRIAASGADVTLIEGAGGLLTPLNLSESLLDLFALLDAPCVLVVANRLGALNHALLSVETLHRRAVPVLGYILVDTTQEDGTALDRAIRDDNAESLARLSALPRLGRLPYIRELHSPDPLVRERGWEKAAAVFRHSPLMDLPPPRKKADEENLLAYDREHLWHPYTSALSPIRAREAVSTRGTRITLRDGRRLIDGMASWWCAVHGYRHPALMRALGEQAARMPHVMFGGLTHEPAVRLARQLLRLAPGGLDRVFFADSGSVAVEVAIKMALQYQRATGHPERSRIMTVRGGYHGDTLGAMSVCDPETGMHADFRAVLPEQTFAPRPSCRFDAPYDPAPALAFERTLEEHGGRTAAVILEPILQGAGGMWMYHPEYLRRVHALCKASGCLLVLDEIATGFGRTGKLFACEWAGIAPDILCLGKALTGGVMSLAATLATREVAEGISRRGGVLMHGPTFMANPLACAVAGASLDLLETSCWRENVARVEGVLKGELGAAAGLPGLADVRVLGAVGVLETTRPVAVEKAQDYCVRRGVWIRPFGRLLYAMPAYAMPEDELRLLGSVMRGLLEEQEWE